MTHEKLVENVKRELDNAYEVMQVKNHGYASEKDALHNFTVGAALQGNSEAQTLGGYLAKHIVSIYDLLQDQPLDKNPDIWHEKITDAIVYLAMLHAMMEEANSHE